MDINITRTLNAPLERVWDVWTNPEHISKWWGPKGFTGRVGTFDFKEGGKYMYCMRGPAGSDFDKDMWSGGVFKEIVPMTKLVVTDQFMDEQGNAMDPKVYGMEGDWPEEMVVTVNFEDLGDNKTKMTLKHEGHPEKFASDATSGWNESLDKFEAAL